MGVLDSLDSLKPAHLAAGCARCACPRWEEEEKGEETFPEEDVPNSLEPARRMPQMRQLRSFQEDEEKREETSPEGDVPNSLEPARLAA